MKNAKNPPYQLVSLPDFWTINSSFKSLEVGGGNNSAYLAQPPNRLATVSAEGPLPLCQAGLMVAS